MGQCLPDTRCHEMEDFAMGSISDDLSGTSS